MEWVGWMEWMKWVYFMEWVKWVGWVWWVGWEDVDLSPWTLRILPFTRVPGGKAAWGSSTKEAASCPSFTLAVTSRARLTNIPALETCCT